jgi:hypothetical protein
MVIPLPPAEALVVNVARCLDAGSMIKQANSVLVEAACGVSYYREEGNVGGGRGAIPRTAPGPKLCLNVASINHRTIQQD